MITHTQIYLSITLRQSSTMGLTLSAISLAIVLFFSNPTNGQKNSSHFLNPILPGFHPDPSCTFIASEETFYCASSSFNAFPGIPIHASKDLQTWRLVGELAPQSTLARILTVPSTFQLPARTPRLQSTPPHPDTPPCIGSIIDPMRPLSVSDPRIVPANTVPTTGFRA